MGYDRTWTACKTWTSEILASADLNSHVRDNLLFLKENIALEAATELTIDTGAITKTRCYHDVDTESDAETDDLDTISGGAEGDILFIRPENTARTVVVKHNTGNIWNPSGEDITLDDIDDGVLLLYGANSKWLVIGGGSASDLAAHIADTDPHTGYVLESLIDAKGDLIVGSADNTPARLAVGSDNQVLRVATDAPAWEDKFDSTTPSDCDAVSAGGAGSAATAARRDHIHKVDASIADDAVLTVDQADAADNDIAKFTANGIEGRSYAEVKSDLDLEVGTDFPSMAQSLAWAMILG